jgi:hypothetical protein
MLHKVPYCAASSVALYPARRKHCLSFHIKMRRLQKKAVLRLVSCILGVLYLVSLFSGRVHLLKEAHLDFASVSTLHAPFTIEADHDDGDHQHHPHPASDHKALLAAVSTSPTHSQWFPAPISPLFFCLLSDHSSATLVNPDVPGPSPPELICTWQFSFRAALPARAPSFIS